MITIVLLIFLLWIFLYSYLRTRRIIELNKLNALYDEMEFYCVKNQVVISNNVINYLRGYKNIVINPQYADIQMILGFLITSDKKKLERFQNEYNELLKTIPNGLKAKGEAFEIVYHRLVRLSYFKIDFVWFFITQVIWGVIFNSFSEKYKALKTLLARPFIVQTNRYGDLSFG